MRQQDGLGGAVVSFVVKGATPEAARANAFAVIDATEICSTESCVERATSVSSMRSTNSPPKWRANAHEYSAVRAVPRCRKPVGDGAIRVRIF